MNNISDVIETLAAGRDLGRRGVSAMFCAMMDGNLTHAQTAALLTALKIKGETSDEIAGAAEAMVSRARTVRGTNRNTVDLCGTGGDSKGTFNISTTASFITAGAGVPVAKHGNRSVSSPVGSADVLEAAGVNIQMDPEAAGKCLEDIGITFLFAPVFHPSMKNVAPVRKELGVRTVFNILGPLVNPARVKNQLIGVTSEEIMVKMASVAVEIEMNRCMVVTGKDGTDEITTASETDVFELLEDGSTQRYSITPEQFGMKTSDMRELSGGKDAAENSRIMKAVLEGGAQGAKTDTALLNAAATIYISGLQEDMGSALEAARHSLESGAAMEKLTALVEVSCG